jgi:hypothetical protein
MRKRRRKADTMPARLRRDFIAAAVVLAVLLAGLAIIHLLGIA